jgi:predicted DNA-binding antitoxin AbrB/MazE fold protein
MIQLELTFDGHVFVPRQPVDLPAGYKVTVSVVPTTHDASEKSLLDLLRLADKFPRDPNAPTDRAAQHDHYLYGTPKRP